VGPMAPDHAYLRQVRDRFVRRAAELVQSASKSRGPARLDKLTEALRVWSATEGAEAAYREAFAADPTLDVAVDDVPRGAGPWVRSPADARVTRLLYLPVLARDDDVAMHGKAAGQLAADVTTTDLGRRVLIRLRPDVPWSDGSRPVGSIDVQRALTDSAEPASPRYSARWADLLDRVEVPDPTHVEVRLTRVFLNPGAWFLGPVGPAHAAVDGRATALDRGRELVGDGPFRWSAASGPDRAEVIASDPPSAGDGPTRARVRRVKEIRRLTAAQTLGAFTRGEVSLVEHVPPDRVAGLAANPSFKVGRYARPRLHGIALDGRNPALRNRNLRRGLSTAIDRRTLLEETLLRRPADDVSLVSDGPFPRGNHADAPDVKPLVHDGVPRLGLRRAGDRRRPAARPGV
ncbi:MAG: ABC transporter substrate-binding protein, partial [Planctomycetia bacterium]|nr:ABC transporter substrate-binding protein [Planctomycetia bacterium]